MKADQCEKKARQLRGALEETTQRLGRHFTNPFVRQTQARKRRMQAGSKTLNFSLFGLDPRLPFKKHSVEPHRTLQAQVHA